MKKERDAQAAGDAQAKGGAQAKGDAQAEGDAQAKGDAQNGQLPKEEVYKEEVYKLPEPARKRLEQFYKDYQLFKFYTT